MKNVRSVIFHKMTSAHFVTLEPVDHDIPIGEGYLTEALNGVEIKIDGQVVVPYFGKRLKFEVLFTEPKGVVVVTEHTRFRIQKPIAKTCPTCGAKLK